MNCGCEGESRWGFGCSFSLRGVNFGEVRCFLCARTLLRSKFLHVKLVEGMKSTSRRVEGRFYIFSTEEIHSEETLFVCCCEEWLASARGGGPSWSCNCARWVKHHTEWTVPQYSESVTKL